MSIVIMPLPIAMIRIGPGVARRPVGGMLRTTPFPPVGIRWLGFGPALRRERVNGPRAAAMVTQA